MRLHISWARPPKLNHQQMSDIHLTHCQLCGTACSGAAGLVNHYRSSPRHPKCPRCGTGFFDSKALETVRSCLIWSVTGRIEHGVGGIARYRETPTDDVLRSFRRHRGPRRALLQLDEPQALRLVRDRVQGGERFARGMPWGFFHVRVLCSLVPCSAQPRSTLTTHLQCLRQGVLFGR